MDTKSPTFNPTFQPSLVERILVASFKIVNRFIPWHKLPSFIGVLNIDALRIEPRQHSLQDGYASGTVQGHAINDPLTDERFGDAPNSDGKFNSMAMPKMGWTGMRFRRNFPK